MLHLFEFMSKKKKLSIKYQSFPKSTKIDTFEAKSSLSQSPSDKICLVQKIISLKSSQPKSSLGTKDRPLAPIKRKLIAFTDETIAIKTCTQSTLIAACYSHALR